MGGALCTTHAVFHVPTAAHQDARFGFIVSKAVGNAVARNRVRRRMKHVVEQRLAGGFTGVDVVFRALPSAASAPYAELAHDMNRSLDRLEQQVRQRAAGSP